MIDKITIRNFKSIVDLTMDLGRINIIIGANGCGKTNILEAITLGSAASQRKLDNEFLGVRLRYTPAQYMRSAFEDISPSDKITIQYTAEEENRTFELANLNNTWHNIYAMSDYIKKDSNLPIQEQIIEAAKDKAFMDELLESLSLDKPSALKDFLIYSPEETKLRTFSDDTYISPFGRRGEGLFQHLKQLTEKQDKETIQAINEGLYMLDWFDGFNIPEGLLTNEYKLAIGDRYLNESLHYFDQRSTNEGFLYLLFYLTLFNSKETPSFFAIDNIETSFNPKLCTKLTEYLIDVAQRTNKQVILTTHSPYVLDGLDLSNDETRLFVARRDIDGHTRVERIPHRENRNMLLSDLWMSGLIGGLPDNF